MSTPAPAKRSFFKIIVGTVLGLGTGVGAMYFNAALDRIVKPAKPLANFQVNTDGLTVICENRASGQSGYWDFGDGTALEPFDPNLQTVQHTYPKAGKYDVKLIVRNFLMEEADRSVTVEIAAATLAHNAPQVLDLQVQTVNATAPATFRITGKLLHTDELILKLGDKTEHILAPAETIDHYFRVETAGKFPIVLAALSKSRKDPQIIVQAVDVKPLMQDTYEAMVTVTDAVMKVEVRQHLMRLPAPIGDAKGATKGFSKIFAVGPHCVITKAEVPATFRAVSKNVKVELSKDQKYATVSGEWSLLGTALQNAAGGADMMIPLSVTEEHREMASPEKQVLTGLMGSDKKILVPLPPRVLGSTSRSVTVDFGISRKDAPRAGLAVGTLDAQGRWQSTPIKLGEQTWNVVVVTRPDNKVELSLTPAK